MDHRCHRIKSPARNGRANQQCLLQPRRPPPCIVKTSTCSRMYHCSVLSVSVSIGVDSLNHMALYIRSWMASAPGPKPLHSTWTNPKEQLALSFIAKQDLQPSQCAGRMKHRVLSDAVVLERTVCLQFNGKWDLQPDGAMLAPAIPMPRG